MIDSRGKGALVAGALLAATSTIGGTDNPWGHRPRGPRRPKKTHELSTRAKMAKRSRKRNRGTKNR